MLWEWFKDVGQLKRQLMEKIRPRHRDRAYLDSYRETVCIASDNGIDICGEPAVGAHIRCGQEGATGLKPDDCLTHPLCQRHHDEQHACTKQNAEEWFIIEKIYKPVRRRIYLEWKRDQEN